MRRHQYRRRDKTKIAAKDIVQWFKHGDHLKVSRLTDSRFYESNFGDMSQEELEARKCIRCKCSINAHGWIRPSIEDATARYLGDTPKGDPEGEMICPGSWVVNGPDDHYWAVNTEYMEDHYEVVKDDESCI